MTGPENLPPPENRESGSDTPPEPPPGYQYPQQPPPGYYYPPQPPPGYYYPPQPPPPVVVVQKKRSKAGLIALLVLCGLLVAGGYFAWQFIQDRVAPAIQDTLDSFVPSGNSQTSDPTGRCYNLTFGDDGVVTDWSDVSCAGPRDAEVTRRWTVATSSSFPGQQALNQEAAGMCIPALETYVGTPFEETGYWVDWLVPSSRTWADGDRTGMCLVVMLDGSRLTGTVKGSGG